MKVFNLRWNHKADGTYIEARRIEIGSYKIRYPETGLEEFASRVKLKKNYTPDPMNEVAGRLASRKSKNTFMRDDL